MRSVLIDSNWRCNWAVERFMRFIKVVVIKLWSLFYLLWFVLLFVIHCCNDVLSHSLSNSDAWTYQPSSFDLRYSYTAGCNPFVNWSALVRRPSLAMSYFFLNWTTYLCGTFNGGEYPSAYDVSSNSTEYSSWAWQRKTFVSMSVTVFAYNW